MVKDRSEAMLLSMADLGLGKEMVAVLLEMSGDYHRDHIRFMKGPVVVHRSPWDDTIPKWLFDGIAGDRLRIIFQEREEGVVGQHIGPVELSAVMYPAMLESPTSSEVSDLYLWATTKACARRDDKPEAVYWENLGCDPVEDRHVLEPNGRCHHAYRELAHAVRSKVLEQQMERERAEKRTKKPAPAVPVVAEELPLFALAKVPA
ncbi:MAG: hypothetical protein IID48_00330 [Proteobacteria bacterium]|nr:hypothetical protein [Pseudomonadota bacterium]